MRSQSRSASANIFKRCLLSSRPRSLPLEAPSSWQAFSASSPPHCPRHSQSSRCRKQIAASLRSALDAYDQGKIQQAEPALRDLATRYPKNYEANEALGSLYTETNDLPHALTYLRRASTISPKEALAHANLGALYLKMAERF